MEKFSRDGAKYVCKFCKKTYFTKTEVEACFDGHGEEALAKLRDQEDLKKEDRRKRRAG